MKNLFALSIALFATPTIAHSGHTASMNGHSHTYFEIAVSSIALATILGCAMVILARVAQK